MTNETDRAGESADGGLLERGRTLVRRAFADPSETDRRLERLDEAERRPVERHSLGNRVSHWVQVVLFTLLLWTGLAIWTGNYAGLRLLDSGIWGGYYIAFGIHMWAGVLAVAVTFVIFPYYYVVADRHRQLLEMADIQVGTAILSAFLGLREYLPYYHEARRAYDDEEGDWVAHHPAQKTFFWWFAVFMGLLALTGFAMFREMTADPSWWISTLGFLAPWFAFEFLKQVHLVLAFVTLSMVVFHVYFAVIPGNWDILRSMVTGDIRAYVLRGDADDGEPAATDDGRGDGDPAATDGGRGDRRPGGNTG